MMENEYIEGIASSLVREYLSRKGLKITLQVMDEESPRTSTCISNRQTLLKELQIEKLMKNNKEQAEPLKAMLEVIAKYLIERNNTADSVANGQSSKGLTAYNKSSKLHLKDGSLESPFDMEPARQIDLTRDNSEEVQGPDRFTTVKAKAPKSAKGKRENNDLIIDENVEGETVLGEGKAGMLQKEEEQEQSLPKKQTQARPLSAKRRGLSGPVTSSVEDTSRKKFNKPRPISSAKNQRLDIFENASKDSIDVTQNSSNEKFPADQSNVRRPSVERSTSVESRTSSSSYRDTDLEEIDSLISQPVPRRKIQDVLEVERDRPKTGKRRETTHYSVEKSSIIKEKLSARGNVLGSSNNSSQPTKVGDVEIGDVDDLEIDVAKLNLGPRTKTQAVVKNPLDSKPIDVQTATELKTLVFGSALQNFNDEWRLQSFCFCDTPGLRFGIVQKKGGPCGVLASVQACMLQELLFSKNKITLSKYGDPGNEERSSALATGLSKIFWRAGQKKQAVVTLPSGRTLISAGGRFRSDDLIETIMIYTFKDFDDLLAFVKQNIHQFELDGYCGVVLSLYSVILSRTVDGVREDMDEPGGQLMGAHGYCSQDMVNLYLTGRAVSNVFNDVVELESGNGEKPVILKGLSARSDIGLLSLFEHYKSCQVGTYYKTPRYPIWVICSESHFSILFSIKRDLISDWKAERRFHLYYFDGLARQQQEIKLTIDTTNVHYKGPSEDEGQLVPPLELCIRTKWNDVEIDWNGTEPLL
ncbi:hypothetical protein CHS0354_023182 [Potamilus streckersoni]|uniref:Ubiquitin carboxyl-terminal hydrolase MINDY n=1 Tax=Potamilus streckersoni TaxID=2493646 RepID=A0AAE0SJR2_9BIVA|nr:hypothetical protein CHS0354_023182 [Potamilus streckersoni]